MKKEKIIELLIPKMDYLIKIQVRKYENSQASEHFNENDLLSLGYEVLNQVADLVIDGKVDEQGMYNFYQKCFINRCLDKYKFHYGRIKRGSLINIESNDLNFERVHLESPYNAEQQLIHNEHSEELVNFLKKHDKKSKPLSLIISYFLEGYSIKEISELLNLKEDKVNRLKREACSLFEKAQIHELQEHLEEDDVNLFKFFTNHSKNSYTNIYNEHFVFERGKDGDFISLLVTAHIFENVNNRKIKVCKKTFLIKKIPEPLFDTEGFSKLKKYTEHSSYKKYVKNITDDYFNTFLKHLEQKEA